MFKIINRNIKRCEICSKLRIKTPENVIDVVLVFLLILQGIFYKSRVTFDKGQKGHVFMKNGHQKFHPLPCSVQFLSVLHQNKALHNFRKRGLRLIVERNIVLEYALLWTYFIPVSIAEFEQVNLSWELDMF